MPESVPTFADFTALQARVAALEAAAPAPPPDDPDTIHVRTPAEWYALTLEAGKTYILDAMTIAGPLVVSADGVTVKAAPGERVTFHAFRPLTGTPQQEGDVYWMKYGHSLYTHPATQEGPWQGHRDRMRPEQFLVNGRLLEAVYSADDLAPGTFYVEGPSESPDAVWLTPHEGEGFASIAYAHHPRLLYGTGKNVVIEGIVFEGAASTGKRGAVLTGDGWALDGVTCRYSAGPGFEMTGAGVDLIDCTGEHNGQLNYLLRHVKTGFMDGCRSFHGNRKGFNAAWEAGGLKCVNDWQNPTDGLTIRDYISEDDDGPGLWFDINNRGVKVYGATVRNSLAAGIMFEFGNYGTVAQDLRVEGVRRYEVPGKTWARQDGIVWQAAVHGGRFERMHAEDCEKPFVFKEHEGRGASTGNTLNGLTASRVQRGSVYIERMSDAAILAAIAGGAKPDTLDGWKNAGNSIEELQIT